MSSRRKRAAITVGIVVILLTGAGSIAAVVEARTVAAEGAAPGMPGNLVEVAGSAWRLDCSGTGSPTVVLEAGLGESGLTWAGIQPSLATAHRTCSYDRAGMGWSDPSPNDRDAATLARELDALLDEAGIDDRLLLVAHSLGSFVAREFAEQQPDRVAGLVLIDPTDESSVVAAGVPVLQEMTIRLQALAARLGILRPFAGSLVTEAAGATPPEAVRTFATWLYRGDALDASARELRASVAGARQLAGTLDLPVVTMLSADSAADREHFAALSPDAQVVDMPGSGHYVHYLEPATVVSTVEAFLAELDARHQ